MDKIDAVCFIGLRRDKLYDFEPNNPVAIWVRERLQDAIKKAVNRGRLLFLVVVWVWISGRLISLLSCGRSDKNVRPKDSGE